MTDKTANFISLQEFWPYHVTVLSDKASRYIMSVVRTESDLNASQWRVLAAVADKPGRTAAEVAAVTPMDKTIISRAVQSLIKDGHLKKSPTSDKRRRSLSMTPSGEKLYTCIAAKLKRDMGHDFFDASEQAALIQNLKSFIKKMDELPSKAE